MKKQRIPFLSDGLHYGTPDSGFTRISMNVMVKNKKGEIQPHRISTYAKPLYNFLVDHFNLNEYEKTGKYKIFPSIERIMDAVGCGKSTAINTVAELETILGMIAVDRTRERGRSNFYTIKKFLDSNIQCDRKTENGKWVHKEIDYYLDKNEEQKNNPVQSDPPKAKKNAKGYPDHSHKDDYDISPEDRKKYGSFLDEEIPV